MLLFYMWHSSYEKKRINKWKKNSALYEIFLSSDIKYSNNSVLLLFLRKSAIK